MRYDVYGRIDYDWCFGSNGRTREKYPYSYDAHYAWRKFDKAKPPKDVQSVYSDRMMQWDSKKYEKARKASGCGWIEDISRGAAIKFIESYYDGKCECVGFARCCNVSSGYGIGLFFIKPKDQANETA